MFETWVNVLLVIFAGLVTGAVTVAAAVVVPMAPVRWGLIATFGGSGLAGYIGYWAWLLFTTDWGK